MTDPPDICDLAPRVAQWARLDQFERLVCDLERRATAVSARPTAGTVAHPRLTRTSDALDELVAIDAATIAAVGAVEAYRARITGNARVIEESLRRRYSLARTVAAALVLAIGLTAAVLA